MLFRSQLDVPYATAAVTLPVGVKLLGRLVGVELDDIRIGMPLRARYVERSADVTLIYWAPDTDGPATGGPDTDGAA